MTGPAQWGPAGGFRNWVLAEELGIGFFEWDVRRDTLWWSPGFYRLAGRELAEFTPTFAAYLQLLHDDDRERVAAVLSAALDDQRPFSLEHRVVHAEGAERVLEVRGMVQPARDGRPEKLQGVARDVTEDRRRRREEATIALLSRVSHELRTPLNAILGFAQLIDDEEAAAQIASAGRHLRKLIDELLDLSRAENDELAIDLEVRDLDADAGEALELLAPAAAEQRVRLTHEDAGVRCPVLADPQRLRQIVLNLVGNAVKYAGPGGSVVVSARRDGAMATLRISDDGPGIAPHLLETAFEPFNRLGAEATGIEGAGLGLALSRSFAEAMGGTLVLDSDGRSGTTATLALPVGEPGFSGLILYIEDSDSNVALMRRVVGSRSSAELAVARDARSGLELARSLGPALIMLDLNLPDMRGEDVLRALLADPATAAIPVVALSADASVGRGEDLRALGAYAYLTKPIELARVDELLQDLARRP